MDKRRDFRRGELGFFLLADDVEAGASTDTGTDLSVAMNKPFFCFLRCFTISKVCDIFVSAAFRVSGTIHCQVFVCTGKLQMERQTAIDNHVDMPYCGQLGH
jgi:hypothetical protein